MMVNLREQWALSKLGWAYIVCTVKGHERPQTVMHQGRMVRVCPRCGLEI